jgi:hypothetical protein
VSEAKINDDVARLSEALGLLEFERETWQLACDKIAAGAPADPSQASSGPPIMHRQMAAMLHLASGHESPATSSRLSLEA